MCRDFQNVTKFVYILCFEVIIINSKTSTLWKLNADKTKIIEASSFQPVIYHSKVSTTDIVEDPLFEIIASTEHFGQSWIKHEVNDYCPNCQNNKVNVANNTRSDILVTSLNEDILDCGKPVNFTYYDNLVGVINRNRHPNVPELQAIFSFTKNYGKNKKQLEDFDVDALEIRLRKIRKEKPKSIQMYNQIGNFWRIKGDASKAIECFRKALSSSPHHAEVLLNLARVLFSLQYLDDAIYLTRRSLEVHSLEKSAWLQYFTLGEIFKAYGHYQEAAIHLRHTLELNPGFEPAQLALTEMETKPASLHIQTLIIIVCMVSGVLLIILSLMDDIVDDSEEVKPEIHFNKTMTMRSLRRLSIASKRCKRST